MTETDEPLLLDLLNTTPVVAGVPRDDLAAAEAGRSWLTTHGGPVSDAEWRELRNVRPVLLDGVRGNAPPAALAPFVTGVSRRARFGGEGVEWVLDVPGGRATAVRAVLAWGALRGSAPGRLRPCASAECRLFLLGRGRAN